MLLITIHAVYLIIILYIKVFATLLTTLQWYLLVIHGLKIIRYSIKIDYNCFTYPFVLLCKNYEAGVRKVCILVNRLETIILAKRRLLNTYFALPNHFLDGATIASNKPTPEHTRSKKSQTGNHTISVIRTNDVGRCC